MATPCFLWYGATYVAECNVVVQTGPACQYGLALGLSASPVDLWD